MGVESDVSNGDATADAKSHAETYARADVKSNTAALDGRPESAPDLRAVARADGKPCAHDELATNSSTDDRTTEPRAVDRADAAPDASADDA